MNEENQNFDELQKLLKLKRYEIPPPRYFNEFSGNVMARIRAGESAGKQTAAETPWIFRFLHIFDGRPGLVGGFATSLCLLLVFGVVLVQRPESAPQDIFSSNTADQSTPQVASLSATPDLAAATPGGGITVSTNPASSLQPAATLFGQPNASQLFTPASFGTSGN
jgi:hypothetical protein